MSAFIHGEAELAEATGIHIKKFQAARIRHLKQGEHWDLHVMRVAYSENGLTAVLEKIAAPVDQKTFANLLEQTRLEKPKTEPIEATLVQFYPNPYRVRIRLPDNTTGNLRIKNKKNFRLGMVVPVRLNGGDLYELARREPRFPGRW